MTGQHVKAATSWTIAGLKENSYDNELREINLLRRENKALEDDNYQKCEIIAELKGRIKKLDRENLGLRQQVANMRRKEEARFKSDAWVD